MSGPKVVRVVTREEIIARCESQLRQVDAAMEEWRRACERNHALDAQALAAVQERRQSLQRMLTEDRFSELQKQIPAELDFLKSDAQTRTARAAQAAAQALQARRRVSNAARMLREELEESGRPLPADLIRDLSSRQTQEQAITRALALLASPPEAETPQQRELADKLGDGQATARFSDWLAAHPRAAGADSDLKIDRQLAELSALGVATDVFAHRAADLANEPPARQALLADSLLVDLAKAVKEARIQQAHQATLREWIKELSADDSAEARELRTRMEAELDVEVLQNVAALVAEAQALVQSHQRTKAAAARRRAVLEGLAALGYDVNEGMATAWVQGGNVVLKKTSTPGYGVELSGGIKSERVQARAVAFGSPALAREPSRDRDAETLWCGDLAKLRSSLSRSGGSIEIEQALPVGAVPLKVIETATAQDSEDEIIASPKTLQR